MTLNERNAIIKDIATELNLRTYQIDCAGKVITCFAEAYSKEFLISACCRYGKTTTALSICKIMQAVFGSTDIVVCILSGLPGSVKSSWRDDAYRLGLINNKDLSELSIENVNFAKTTGIDITFISIQKLGTNIDKNGNKVEHSYIQEYKDFFNHHSGLKVIITDEAHNAFGTDRTTEALGGLNFDYKIELTATPFTYELMTKYRLDSTVGDKSSYFFSQTDMIKLYNEAEEVILDNGIAAKVGFTYRDKNTGEERAWRPVQQVVIVEDIYAKLLAEGFDFNSLSDELNQTAFVSAYFKTIFNDTKKYKKFCDIFIETYIINFANKFNIRNILAFDTTNEFANKVAMYINQNFSSQIFAKSLADEKLDNDETSVDKANQYFEQEDNKIHFVITCRKCGTGSSMPRLDAAMFLKGVVSYIEYCQFGARSLTPADNKKFGYVIMFSPSDALQMIAQHANSEKHDTTATPNMKNIKDYLQYIKVFLDGTELTDATDIMSKLDTIYRPGQTILFPSLDLSVEDIFAEIADTVIRDAKFKARTAQTPKRASGKSSMNNDNDETESNNTKKSDEGEYTKESLMKAFQQHFVELIEEFYEDDYTEDDIRAINNDSDERTKRFIKSTLCGMRLWNKLNQEYFDKILHKVYVYATKVVIKNAE